MTLLNQNVGAKIDRLLAKPHALRPRRAQQTPTRPPIQ